MTLSSRHRIRNSSPSGLRPSTLPLGHGGSPKYWLSHVDGEETFLFLSNRRDRGPNPESGVKGSGATHNPRVPAKRETKKQMVKQTNKWSREQVIKQTSNQQIWWAIKHVVKQTNKWWNKHQVKNDQTNEGMQTSDEVNKWSNKPMIKRSSDQSNKWSSKEVINKTRQW